jgi:hypothetical protein
MTTAAPSNYLAIANEVSRQLGGALVMIGAKNLAAYHDNGRPTLSFGICRNKAKVTHIRIIVEHNDTYTVEFIRVVKFDRTVLSTHDMVYADMLKELISTQTGLATSL